MALAVVLVGTGCRVEFTICEQRRFLEEIGSAREGPAYLRSAPIFGRMHHWVEYGDVSLNALLSPLLRDDALARHVPAGGTELKGPVVCRVALGATNTTSRSSGRRLMSSVESGSSVPTTSHAG